jgi:hypothetical protein
MAIGHEPRPEGSPLPDLMPVSICIPARNEEAVIGGLLDGLASLDLAGIAAYACFYLDGCTDSTERLLHAAKPALSFPIVLQVAMAGGEPNAGRARREAMACGMVQAADGLLLTTDADSRPGRGWIQAAVRALAVADVAAGRIVRMGATADAWQTRVEAYYDRLYRLRRMIDPVPWEGVRSHHFSGGANLAFRASAYRAIGGFRPIPSAEDATALDDSSRAGLRVRRDPDMIVETSSRRHGRAPGGLAAALCGIDAGDVPRVPHPRAAAWQYRRHALARQTFAVLDSREARETFGRAIGLTGDHVLGVGRDCPNAEAFAMRIVPTAPHHQDLIPLVVAEQALIDMHPMPCEQAA